MAGNNAIGTDAIILTANADQALAGFDKVTKAADKFTSGTNSKLAALGAGKASNGIGKITMPADKIGSKESGPGLAAFAGGALGGFAGVIAGTLSSAVGGALGDVLNSVLNPQHLLDKFRSFSRQRRSDPATSQAAGNEPRTNVMG